MCHLLLFEPSHAYLLINSQVNRGLHSLPKSTTKLWKKHRRANEVWTKLQANIKRFQWEIFSDRVSNQNKVSVADTQRERQLSTYGSFRDPTVRALFQRTILTEGLEDVSEPFDTELEINDAR